MNEDFLNAFIRDAARYREQEANAEKRKKFFTEIGRKGGLKKKTDNHYSKKVSVRFTEKEYENLVKNAVKNNLKTTVLIRQILTEKELKINEFKTDEILLKYGTNFIRIRNLLRNKEWTEFENKKKILDEIEQVIFLIREYLYQKILEREQFSSNQKDQ